MKISLSPYEKGIPWQADAGGNQTRPSSCWPLRAPCAPYRLARLPYTVAALPPWRLSASRRSQPAHSTNRVLPSRRRPPSRACLPQSTLLTGCITQFTLHKYTVHRYTVHRHTVTGMKGEPWPSLRAHSIGPPRQRPVPCTADAAALLVHWVALLRPCQESRLHWWRSRAQAERPLAALPAAPSNVCVVPCPSSRSVGVASRFFTSCPSTTPRWRMPSCSLR